jgi:phospholipid-translocating ATPase
VQGADNIIKSRLSTKLNSPELLAKLDDQLMGYVNDGLRTLMLAKAELQREEYQRWAVRYHEAETSTDNREKRR